MPLGLAKNILTKGSAAVARTPMTDRGYWTSTGTTSSGANAATVICDRTTTYSNVGNITVSYWFRGTTADLDSDEADILVARSNDNFAIHLLMFKGSGTNIKYMTQHRPSATHTNQTLQAISNFDTLYLDNNWHHVVGTLRSNTTTYIRQVYLDGVQLVNSSESGKTAFTAATINRYWWCGSGPDNTPLSAYTSNPDAGGHKLDIANLAVWHSHIDLPTNITKFWDNGGGVDLGTDGTASGLTQAQLIMRSNVAGNMVGASGSIANGGSLTWTIYGSREGTGNIQVFTSGGPT